jgi:transcriptional/translational regulatory protein YebC/TACO1
MLTQKKQSISEQDIQKTTEKYLSNCLAKDEEEFNRQLKEQFDDIITAITDLIPRNKNKTVSEVRQSVQKHIKSFRLRYKKRDGPKPDYVAKRLTAEFKDYFVSLIGSDNAQKNYPQNITTTDKEIIALSQIADMFLETKDATGKDILLQIEFEAEYNTDKEMDRRILHYESFVDFDQQRRHAKNKQQPERELFTQVFYLRRSPKSGSKKPLIEHVSRTVTTPTLSVPKLIKYTAYHVYQFDIVEILQVNLPFLFCFVGNMSKVTPKKIRQHEPEIRQLLYGDLTETQRDVMRAVLVNFKQKGYYEANKSDNIDIIRQMIEISEMYRGNEEVVRVESLKQGIQQGEKITSLKWFLRGQLGFSALVEELGEQKANRVQQNADNLKYAVEKGTPLVEILEQLDENRELLALDSVNGHKGNG